MKTTRVKRKIGDKNATFRLGGYGQATASFPLRLWEPAGWWWSKLSWTTRSENRSGLRSLHEVTWLELVIDFEPSTGPKCVTENSEDLTWGGRARLLKYIIKKLLQVRGIRADVLKTWYGEHKPRVASLASFGLNAAQGLRRRPYFHHPQALSCIGKNAFFAELGCTSCPAKESEFGGYVLDFTGFKSCEGGRESAAARLEAAAKAAEKPSRRLTSKTSPSSAFILHT